MKTKAITGIAIALSVAVLASCSFAVPTKVQVKASPTVNAPFGSKEFKLSDEFSVSDLTESFGDSSSTIKVYDYFDGSDEEQYNIQKFLINMRVMDINVDFEEYISDLDFGSSLATQLGEQGFDIPSVDISQSGTTSFPIDTIIGDQLSAGAPLSIPMVESGSGSVIAATIPDQTVTATGFDTVTFSAGSLAIALSVTGNTASYALNVTNVAILDGATIIAQSATTVNAVSGGTVSIPLTGITLPASFKLRVTANTSGGTPLHPCTLNATPSFSNCTVSAATGFSIASETVDIGPEALAFSPEDGFVSATIGNGSITVNVPFPSTITGCTRILALSVQQPGGLNLSGTFDLSDGPAVFDLGTPAQTLNTNAITVSGTITIDGDDVDATALDGGSIDLTWTASANIAEFASLVLDAGDSDLSITQTIEQGLDDISAWVKWINFDKVGFSLDFTNNLPPGNDLIMTVSSTAFALGPLSITLEPDDPTTPAVEKTTVSAFKGSGNNDPLDTDPITNGEGDDYHFVVVDPGTGAVADIDYTISVEPASLSGGQVTLYDIVPGGHYSFAEENIAFVTDWSRASIDPGASYQGSFPETSGETIDLSMLGDIVSGDVQLDGIEARLYLNKFTDGVFDLTGNILAAYDGGASTQPLLGGADGSRESVTFAPAMPVFRDSGEFNTAWVSDTDETDVVFESTAGYTRADAPLPSGTDAYQELSNMDTILNDAPGDLRITYDFLASSLEITPDDLAEDARLTGDLVLILPFVVNATADAVLPLDEYMPELDEDLLGRDEIGGDTDIDRILDSLATMNLSLSIQNELGIGISAKLYQDSDGVPGNEWESETFAIDYIEPVGGVFEIQHESLGLNQVDVAFIKAHEFLPQVEILLPAGNYPLSRTGGITIGVTASVHTDVDQTFEF